MAKKEYIKLITEWGRLSFPNLIEPSTKEKNGKVIETYETGLFIPKTSNIKPIIEASEQVAKNEFGPKFVSLSKLGKPPIRDGEVKGDEYKDYWLIRATTYERPRIVNGQKIDLEEIARENGETLKDYIYGGAWARLNISVSTYDFKDESGVRSWGVKYYLNAVQWQKKGERFGGERANPVDAFESFEQEADAAAGDEIPF